MHCNLKFRVKEAKRLRASIFLLAAIFVARQAPADFMVQSVDRSAFGYAGVQGFPRDDQYAWDFGTGDFNQSVYGQSGDANNFVNYTSSIQTSIPAQGSSITGSATWVMNWQLSNLPAVGTVGVGANIFVWFTIDTPQHFSLTGSDSNSTFNTAVYLGDPDNHPLVQFADYSNTNHAFSFEGDLIQAGTYRLQVVSSIIGGGIPSGSSGEWSSSWNYNFTVTPVPEPCALTLLGLGAIGLLGLAWRRRRR